MLDRKGAHRIKAVENKEEQMKKLTVVLAGISLFALLPALPERPTLDLRRIYDGTGDIPPSYRRVMTVQIVPTL